MKEIRVKEKADGNLEVTIIKKDGVTIKFTDVVVAPYGADDEELISRGGE